MIDIQGKWALVTGASRGLGFLAAQALAQRGCNVILQSRTAEHLQKAAAAISELGVEVKCVSCELAEEKSVRDMLAEIDSFGVDVDIVLNNAGLQIAYRTDYYATPVSDYTVSFAVNTIAPAII